jgi:RNA polymerase sigma-70 factor, ECF subfamily
MDDHGSATAYDEPYGERYGETALVDGLRARDEAAFLHLVDSWGATMRRVARTFVSTDASAEEVVQDTWVAVLQGIDRFEGRSSLRTWVFRILANIARTRGTREHRTVPMSSLDGADRGGPTVDPDRFRSADDEYPGGWRRFPDPWHGRHEDALAGALGQDVRELVDAAVDELPARQRTVVTLRDLHGFDADEVCALLDLSPGNQRVLLHRGRAHVRGRLEEHYGAVARWGATP